MRGRGRGVPRHVPAVRELPVTGGSTVQARGRHAPDPGYESVGSDLLNAVRATSGEALITVSRQSRDDIGFREVFLSVDGEQIAILKHGESVTHEVSPGSHTLRAHNTLFRKKHDIVLRPGDHVRFTVINRAGWGTFGALIMLGAFPVYLTFERENGP